MSNTTEHFTEIMNYSREAAITARAETLKEIITFCDELQAKYKRTPLWTIQEVKINCETKLKELSL